jgi:hypothetical protein
VGLFGPSSDAAPVCDGDFHIRKRFDFGGETTLHDVTVTDTGDVWALGSYRADRRDHVLVLHRGADGWEQVPVADPSGREFAATGIDVDETGAVWLSGFRFEEDLIESAAVLRYDGAEWSDVPTPDFRYDSPLWDVDAVSSTDVWAVGAFEHPDTQNEETLALHYEGDSFTQEPTPSPGYIVELRSVEATNSTDVWAVGDGDRRPMALHWDGSTWTERRFPDFRSFSPLSVAAHADGRAWAVGLADVHKLRSKLVEWNGTAWEKVRIPNPDGHDLLIGIDVSGDRGWAVGERRLARNDDFVLAWDGTDWARAHAGTPGRSSGLLQVAIGPDQTAWAVGYFYPRDGPSRAMVQRACI